MIRVLLFYHCFLILAYEYKIRQNNQIKAVLVDIEEGVIGEMMRGPLGSLFDHNQLVSSVSGSGNNWCALVLLAHLHRATAHCGYGHKYREQLSDVVRRAAESCDALQCFFILHSLDGGLLIHCSFYCL